MPIVVTASTSVASTTVQNIIDDVAQDIRQLLAASGTDANILLNYVDRVHREICLSKRWKFMLSDKQSFTTVAGSTDYYIGADVLPSGVVNTNLNLTDLRTIVPTSVFDRSNYHQLFKTDEQPLDQFWTLQDLPRVWRNDTSNSGGVINFYPVPNGAYTIEFRYNRVIKHLTTLADILQIPDDYRYVVVAGVNRLALLYLKRYDDAAAWKEEYAQGRMSMVRDSNLFPRNDYMVPA